MKKIKLLSACIVVLVVIAIGVVSGKQVFRYLEAGSSQGAVHTPGHAGIPAEEGQSVQTHILYSSPDSGQSPSAATPQRTADLRQARLLPTVKADAPSAQSNPAGEPASRNMPEKPNSQAGEMVFDPQGEPWAAFASGSGTNVREGPGLEHKFMWKVNKGTKGTVLAKENGWTQIKWDFNKKTGWVRDDLLLQGPSRLVTGLLQNRGGIDNVSAEQLAAANEKMAKAALRSSSAIAKPAPVAETAQGFVAGADLPRHATIFATSMANVRSEPSVRAARVARLPKGVAVEIKAVKKVDRYHWFQISFNQGKKSGWTREDNLKF